LHIDGSCVRFKAKIAAKIAPARCRNHVMRGHSRSKNGVASLAHSRSKNGVASLAHSRSKNGVASLAYGPFEKRQSS
jgi:hypothetical protein